MYNVSKAPSKLVTQTRRGISQHLERLENRKESNKKSEELDQRLSAPKPVFHTNGYLKKNNPESQLSSSRETISPQHAELIRYINDLAEKRRSGNHEEHITAGSSTEVPELESTHDTQIQLSKT